MSAKRVVACLIALVAIGCSSDHRRSSETLSARVSRLPTEPSQSIHIRSLPAFYQKFRSQVTVTWDPNQKSDWVYLSSNSVPDYCSPYFCHANMPNCANPSAPGGVWCAFNSPLFTQEPNLILEQNFVFKIPAFPSLWGERLSHWYHAQETGAGAIGIAVNGVVLYDQYIVDRATYAESESATFDKYHGHPDNNGIYHYHLNPSWIISAAENPDYGDPKGLVGVMLDGVPLYGPMDPDGTFPSLGLYHGHYGDTPDGPMWHYHVTTEHPYFVGRYKGKTIGTYTNVP